jgi:hypothetical protein
MNGRIKVTDSAGYLIPSTVIEVQAYQKARRAVRKASAAWTAASERVTRQQERVDEARWALNEADAADRPRTGAWRRHEAAQTRLYDLIERAVEAESACRSAWFHLNHWTAELAALIGVDAPIPAYEVEAEADRAVRAIAAASRRLRRPAA